MICPHGTTWRLHGSAAAAYRARMPTPNRPSRAEAFQEDGDIRAFIRLLGSAADAFEDSQLPQLRREVWAWANFLLHLHESGNYPSLFDTPSTGFYDQDNGFGRSHNNHNPET